MKQHYLRDVPGFKEELIDKLSGLWITSAEQLISHTCTADSLHEMAKELEISDNEMKKYRTIARDYVPRRLLSELESPVSPDEYSYGYNLEKKKRN